MTLKGAAKVEASRRWLEEHDYVQQNTWIPRDLRDDLTRACRERGQSKREVMIHLISGYVQDEYQVPNGQTTP